MPHTLAPMMEMRPFWELVAGVFNRLHAESIRPDALKLRNVAVLDRDDPRTHGPGVAALRTLAREALATAARESCSRGLAVVHEEAFPSAVIDRLAYYSGGVRWDFFSMMMDAAGEAWHAEGMEIGDEIVDAVLLDARRRKEMRINRGEIELLERVMEDPVHALVAGPMAEKLVAQGRLLVYGDDDAPWCYPHPVLTLVLLRPWRLRACGQDVRV